MNQKISDILKSGKLTLSYEMFPPKTADKLEDLYEKSKEIATLNPDFISITYGAGGGISEHTVKIASHVQNNLDVNAIAHLTCGSSDKQTIDKVIEQLKENNISNILALRGDCSKSPQNSHHHIHDNGRLREALLCLKEDPNHDTGRPECSGYALH